LPQQAQLAVAQDIRLSTLGYLPKVAELDGIERDLVILGLRITEKKTNSNHAIKKSYLYDCLSVEALDGPFCKCDHNLSNPVPVFRCC